MFTTVEYAKWYLEVFTKRCVMADRIINFQELNYFEFECLIGKIGRLSLVFLNEASYSHLVRCFYSNMKYKDGGPTRIYVNEVEITFDVAKLCDILKIENDGISIFE